MRLLAIGVVAAAAALTWRPAAVGACRPSRTYFEPTTVELVAKADRIVVATARKNIGYTEVQLEVTRLVKGSGVVTGDAIRLRGQWDRRRDEDAPGGLSEFHSLGACGAPVFAAGASYILVLAARGAGWETLASELAEPTLLRAMKAYARVAAVGDRQRKNAELDALVARGARKGASAADRAIAEDVRRHRATPTPAKPFAELVAMLARAGERDASEVLLAIGVGGDPEARSWMRERIREARLGKWSVDLRTLSEAIAAYFDKVADPAAVGEVAELHVSVGAKHKKSRGPLARVLVERASAAHTDVMVRALAGADDEEAGGLATWFVRHPSAAALADLRARVGTAYVRHEGLTLSLAAMGDARVVAWAKWRLAGPRGYGRVVAMDVLALSPRADAAAARQVFESRGERVPDHLILDDEP